MTTLSYSGLTNFGKMTLPSVETWGSNMNILRDPPKGIYTRKINKVGQTSEITEMIDEAENRASEVILKYARGVNPCVSVSYDNYGSNGGQGQSAQQGMTSGGITQSYGPYVVGKDGAFRPPIRTKESLTALSRQPRVWTTAFTQPGFTDFSKKMSVCGTAEQTKEVKSNLLKTNVIPNSYYKIDKPFEQPNEVKYFIQDIVNMPYNTVSSTTDQTVQNVITPLKGLNDAIITYNVDTNLNDSRYYAGDMNEFNPDRYIQNVNEISAFTNNGTNIQVSYLDENADLSYVKTKDKINAVGRTGISGIEKNEYIHDNIELDRNLPSYDMYTNSKSNEQKYLKHEYMKTLENNNPVVRNVTLNQSNRGENNVSKRDYTLQNKLSNFGSFEGKGTVPNQNRVETFVGRNDPDRSQFNKNIASQYQGRF